MSDLEKAREFFAGDLYATETTGIVIEDVAEGYAKCSLALDRRHKNAMGHTMGGAMFTLADFCFAVATNFGRDYFTVSTVGNICYLSSPKGNTLYGETRILKDGRSTCFYEIAISDDLGNAVATVTMSGTHLKK